MIEGKPRLFYRVDSASPRWFKRVAEAKAYARQVASILHREIKVSRVVLASDRDGLLTILNEGMPRVVHSQVLFIARPT